MQKISKVYLPDVPHSRMSLTLMLPRASTYIFSLYLYLYLFIFILLLQAPVTDKSTATISAGLNVENGKSTATIGFGWHHAISQDASTFTDVCLQK